MGNSYRVRTEIGKDKQLKVNLDQDYEFLDILSFKIRQSELYIRNCSDYGVIVGRVFANNGFGIPNAKINVFIPLTDQDATDPIISTLYPYRDLDALNEDGYRYNLLPYVSSYPGHAATGTFPDRKDVLNNSTVAEIYDKYYKFTVRTNESGDFMIFGAPVGNHKIFMDLDLSDIGDFSLTPQDLIRMGRGTKDQFDGIKFKTSSDLGSLPQIVSLVKEVFVSPLWGENEVCQIGITRQDFDLTTDANIEIRPTSVFMGSIFSTIQKHRLKRTCKVKNATGEFCSLITGPGEIVAIRQTIFNDSNGRPILEQAILPENGKLIDQNGSWLFDVPMNMDYVTTNEFGEQVISNDPSVGIPTTGRYRFKIKWAQSKNINEEFRRAYFLVPNLREYGNGPSDQNTQNSYAFDLDWSGYTVSPNNSGNEIQDFIDCKDKFYKFEYSKVYTVSSFIDNFKRQNGRNKFLAIKEITDPNCESENNKFPVNDGVFNPTILTFVFNLLTLITVPLLSAILIVFNILAAIWPFLKIIINIILGLILALVWLICQAINIFKRKSRKLDCPKVSFNKLKGNPFKDVRLPMMSFPDCELCDSNTDSQPSEEPENKQLTQQASRAGGGGLLPTLGIGDSYGGEYGPRGDRKTWGEDSTQAAISRLLSGAGEKNCQQGSQKDQIIEGFNDCDRVFTYNLPLAEKINFLNTRDMYYRGFTNVEVAIEPTLNVLTPGVSKSHQDNLMVLMLDENNLESFPTGQMLTFVDEIFSKDPNVTGASYTTTAGTNSITGATITIPSQITVNYGLRSNKNLPSQVTYNLKTSGKSVTDLYTFHSDLEYFQVVTGMTVADFMNLSNPNYDYGRRQGLNGLLRGFNYKIFQTGSGNQKALPLIVTPFTNVAIRRCLDCGIDCESSGFVFPEGFDKANSNGPGGCSCCNFADLSKLNYFPWSAVPNFEGKNLIFLQRGVDPKSPRYDTEIDISTFFDRAPNTVKIRGDYKINVPIQAQVPNKMPCAQMLTGKFINNNQVDSSSGQYSFFKSNFYQPATSTGFTGYSTEVIRFYSHLDSDNPNYQVGQQCICENGLTNRVPLSSITNISNNTVYSQNVSRNTYNMGQSPPPICDPLYINRFREANNIDDYAFAPLNYVGGSPLTPIGTTSNPGDWKYRALRSYPGPASFGTQQLDDIDGVSITNLQNLAQLDGGSYAFQRFYIEPLNGADNCDWGINVGNYSIYMSPIYSSANTITITSAPTKSETRLVLRSDRLPSSSSFFQDNTEVFFEDQANNKYMWQQNMNLAVFNKDDDGTDTQVGFSNTDPAGVSTDVEYDQPEFTNVLSSFECEKMVGLKCYDNDDKGNVIINCGKDEDYVQRGAYIFVRKPISGLIQDFENLGEWVQRIRMTFNLCQGVLSEVFNNNWLNGTLFMYPFQQTLIYNNQNKVDRSKHCSALIIRHESSNNFYYRSTPYTKNQGFKIKSPSQKYLDQIGRGGNDAQIMHPTTIMDLGPKSPLLQFSSTNGRFLGYYAGELPQTSFSDTSELINLFALSRMLSAKFLGQLFGTNNGSIRSLFSRPRLKLDGDLAQLFSINSQFGIVKFDEDDYSVNVDQSNQPVRLFSEKGGDPLIGVFFSAETYNLQQTDYVSPGRIIFRALNPNACKNIEVKYGYNTQLTPHYRWQIKPNVTNDGGSIFGTQENNWLTKDSDVVEVEYQKMDRYDTYYFKSSQSGSGDDTKERNYIWNVDTSGNYQEDTFFGMKSDIVVGAPNHFYFGLRNGSTSLDRYFKEYLNIELND